MYHKQKGIVFAVLLFIIVLSSLGFVLHQLNAQNLQRERERKTAEALLNAKVALIGWSVAHPLYPGIMPFPDRSGDGDYDGNSDCVGTGSLAYAHLLGKFPHLTQTSPCVGAGASQYGISADLIDGAGERLWYAVSKNLIRSSAATGATVINPNIVNAPAEPWMIVRDKHGQVISDRVAAVIIAPAMPIGTQNRSGGLAGASAYLDRITISGVNYSNAEYTVANEDFIVGDDMQYVSATHPTYQQPYQFNDKLIYITIDELMATLEKRVVREAAAVLNAYYLASSPIVANRYYPYASAWGGVNNLCGDGLLKGALPIIGQAISCIHSNPSHSVTLPSWFDENDWQDYLYYAVSNDCTYATPGCTAGQLTVGVKTNVKAFLMSAGAKLTAQTRPSIHLTDYFDSTENTNSDLVYDAVGTPLTSTYNDQMLIVAP